MDNTDTNDVAQMSDKEWTERANVISIIHRNLTSQMYEHTLLELLTRDDTLVGFEAMERDEASRLVAKMKGRELIAFTNGLLRINRPYWNNAAMMRRRAYVHAPLEKTTKGKRKKTVHRGYHGKIYGEEARQGLESWERFWGKLGSSARLNEVRTYKLDERTGKYVAPDGKVMDGELRTHTSLQAACLQGGSRYAEVN